jgi:hypothetical protein
MLFWSVAVYAVMSGAATAVFGAEWTIFPMVVTIAVMIIESIPPWFHRS